MRGDLSRFAQPGVAGESPGDADELVPVASQPCFRVDEHGAGEAAVEVGVQVPRGRVAEPAPYPSASLAGHRQHGGHVGAIEVVDVERDHFGLPKSLGEQQLEHQVLLVVGARGGERGDLRQFQDAGGAGWTAVGRGADRGRVGGQVHRVLHGEAVRAAGVVEQRRQRGEVAALGARRPALALGVERPGGHGVERDAVQKVRGAATGGGAEPLGDAADVLGVTAFGVQ